ncbi:MAG: amidohydrolase family protein [Chloroflexi bacterium]|nr:amidohydrolase family protein [Chloroflexota bacterium]
MRVLDIRLRPPSRGFLAQHLYTQHERTAELIRGLGMEPPASLRERSMERLLAEMAAAGVERAVVVGRHAPAPWGGVTNDDVAAIVREHPDLFLGIGSVDVCDVAGALREIDRTDHELGFVGLAIDSTNAREPMLPDDRRLAPLYERCLALDWPLVVTMSHQVGSDIGWGHPVSIDRMAAQWPALPIVVAHASWPYVREALAVAHRRPNVYLVPDIYLPTMPGGIEYVQAANLFLGDRLIFGSTYPIGPHADMVRLCAALPFRPDVRDKFFYDNASARRALP